LQEFLRRVIAGLVLTGLLGGGFWVFSGTVDALIVIALCLGCMLGFHLYYLALLLRWLKNPLADSVPDGLGAWHTVFLTLYRQVRTQNQSKRKLTHVLERFINAGEAMPDGVIVLDEYDRIEWLNPTAMEHFGLDRERDIGNLLLNLIRQPTFHSYIKADNFSQPLVLKYTQPREIVLNIQMVPFDSTRKLLLSRDITQLDMVHTVHRDFVANVSHELRTPLTVIGGFLETLSDLPESDTTSMRHFLPMMLEQSHRMQTLVEDLLILSKLENSPAAVTREKVDMAQMLETLMVEAEGLSHGRHRITLNNETDTCLWGSTRELHSAFGNLVANAVLYTPDAGSVTLCWRLQGERAVFSVTDTGIGVPREHIPRLTERFYRVDRGRSRSNGGTGLGLAIVKHVVARHHARMDIQSEPERGSCFSVTFGPDQIVDPATIDAVRS